MKTHSELTLEAINQEGSGILDDPDFGIIDYDNPFGANECSGIVNLAA